MNRKVHKIYDVILKIIIATYSIEFLRYIGETRAIVEILKTEITTLNGKTKILDFLARLEDDTLCHIEFQFPVAYPEDLERFYDYNILAKIRFEGITETIIFSFGTSNQRASDIKIGESIDFHPRIFYLGDIDFKKELEKIIQKVNSPKSESFNNNDHTDIKLTYMEELHLLLMSLAFKYEDKKELLKPAVELLKKEEIFHSEKLDIIKSVIKLEIDNLLTEDERKELYGDVKMNKNVETIIKQAVEDVNKKYELEAIDEIEKRAYKKGQNDGLKKIAKKLKGTLSIEDISKLTGLSLNTIMLL